MQKVLITRYKYRNIIVLLLFSLILTIIFTFTIYNLININNSNRKIVTAESQVQIKNFEISLNLSRQLVNSVRYTLEAERWAESADFSYEMHSLIKFMELVNKQLSVLTTGECYIGAWKLNSENPSIFYNGATISEEKLFEDVLGIEYALKEDVISKLKKTGEHILFFDETQIHNSFIKLYYQQYSGGEIIYFTLIPYKVLNIDDALWYLKYNNRLIGTSDIELYQNNIDDNRSQTFQKITYSENSGHGFQYTYVKESMALYFLVFVISIVIIISGIILFLILKIMSIVYEPINRIVNDDSKSIDEIKLFQESIVEVNFLNSKLESIKNDISAKTQERKYFNLLIGLREDIDYNIDQFCVSILEFDNFENSDNVFYIKNDLQAYASKDDNIIYIHLDKSRILFIHKVMTYSEAEKQLTHLLHSYVANVNIKIALTDVYDSINQLPIAYEFANKILNFKYHFQEKDIILFSDISNIIDDEYNFSVNVEYTLIHKVLNADKTAIDIFDKFLRENMKNQSVSSSTTEKYILTLINMVNRIFAELKISSLDLIGYEISFTEWQCMRDNPNIINIIRNTLIDIISSLSEKNTSGNLESAEKILDYIHKNYMKDIMLVDINTEFGLSPQRVHMIFKEELNTNFKTYLNEYRINIAQQLQREDTSIKTTELSELVGFNSSTSFIRVYKKHVGLSPQEYQKSLK